MLDLDALEKSVSESVGGPKAAPEPADSGTAAGVGEPTISLAELGSRIRAAQAHGDDEALAQAILDIVHRGR